MTVTTYEKTVYFRDWRMLQVLTGEAGGRDARPTVNLGDGAFKTIYDVAGVHGIDRLTIVTRVVDGVTLLDSARLFNDGVRLATFTGFAVPLADIEARGLAALYSGDDLITGNKWKNVLRGYDGDDTLRGRWGEDTLSGGSGRDWLNGLGGDDRLVGGSGSDLLVGGNENDALFGGAGVDRLSGGTGRDTMTGGAFKDTFVFRSGDGTGDVIADFDPTLDQIEIASGATTFAEVTVTAAGDDVILTFDDVRLRLLGVGDQVARIGPEDFQFT